MSTFHISVDHQLLSREVLQSCNDLIWFSNLPHNFDIAKVSVDLENSSQSVSYTHKKILVIKQSCSSIPEP